MYDDEWSVGDDIVGLWHGRSSETSIPGVLCMGLFPFRSDDDDRNLMSEPAHDRTFLCRFFLGELDFEGDTDREETCDEDSCDDEDCSETEGEAIRGGEPSRGGSIKATSRLGDCILMGVGSAS